MPASRAHAASVAPPSMNTLSMPRFPRAPISCRKSMRPSCSGVRTISQPDSSSFEARSPDALGAHAIIVGTLRADWAIAEVMGVRRRESHITRRGFRPPSIRQVSCGSSASTVPMPTMMAACLRRSACTRSRAAGPVIQRDAPVFVAIFPSSVMAYFSVT